MAISLLLCAIGLALAQPGMAVTQGTRLTLRTPTPFTFKCTDSNSPAARRAMARRAMAQEAVALEAGREQALSSCAREALLALPRARGFPQDLAKSTLSAQEEIPIFVTHYSKLGERRKQLSARLDSMGVRANWLDMFDHEAMPSTVRTCLFGDTAAANYGAAASTWAHFSLFAHMVQHKWPKVLVMEDDALTTMPDSALAGIKASLADTARCMDVLPTGVDTVHVAQQMAGFFITLDGARKMLAWLATSAQHSSPTRPSPIAAATDMLLAQQVWGCPLASDGKTNLAVSLTCPIGPHGEDFHAMCADWASHDFSRYCQQEQQGCDSVRVYHTKQLLWTNGLRGSWYGMHSEAAHSSLLEVREDGAEVERTHHQLDKSCLSHFEMGFITK